MRFKLHFMVTPGAIHEPPEDEICRRLLEVVAKIEHEGVTDYNEAILDENDQIIGDYAAKNED